MKKSIFIFHRDFRLVDNISFINCYNNSDKILPIFIFTPEQITNNKYFSSNGFQFMIESLEELNLELIKYNSKLHFYYGNNIDILKELSAACKEYGLKMGLYISPWDRNNPTYGTPEYNQVYVNMLKEITTQYGDLFL